MRFRQIYISISTVCWLSACSLDDHLSWIHQPLQAMCIVDVTGKGLKDVETDYLPHVISCENGNADIEALKAQAVAARSYMYYKIKTSGGSICDSQGCQVYSCSAQPKQKHFDAVQATIGQVIVYSGIVICSFYVAGAKPSTSNCQALSSDPDPTNTEKYITYNEGLVGNQVEQSSLGYVDPKNLYNRGCKSQNGAHCLSLQGKSYQHILQYYYGADIQIITAQGSCIVVKEDSGNSTKDSGLNQKDIKQTDGPYWDMALSDGAIKNSDFKAQDLMDNEGPLLDSSEKQLNSLQGGCVTNANWGRPNNNFVGALTLFCLLGCVFLFCRRKKYQ